MWEVMFWPIVACVLLPWLLVYLGLHVVQRGVIFVDIAMAQMASLGICVALLFRFDLHGWAAAEGDEEIKQMLVGNILLVTPVEVWKCFALFVFVGIFHFLLRRNFLLVSFDRDRAYQQGLRVRWWDFSFYASFGLVVTIFVRMAGVLLVFSYLIVPAVCVINLVSGVRARLVIGWIIATIGGIGGLFWSFYGDLPSGAAIVCTFGALLIGVSAIGPLLHSKRLVSQSYISR